MARKVAFIPQRAQRPAWQHPALVTLAAASIAILAVTALRLPQAGKTGTGPMPLVSFTKRVLDLKEREGISLGKMSRDPAEMLAPALFSFPMPGKVGSRCCQTVCDK